MNPGEPTAAFHTLGCKVNQGETDAIAGMFKARGYAIVPFDAPADVYVVNTCTVTHLSDRKSRQAIRRANRLNPDAVVVVTGCYAQTAADEVQAIEGVDIVVGTDRRSAIVDLVEEHRRSGETVNTVYDSGRIERFEELPAAAERSRARATMKIQDGCDLYCTYCIIPYARGPVRSRRIESVVEEAGRLADEGFKEIVLSGIHLGAYGSDFDADLAKLIIELCRIPGLRRIRVGSVEPQEFTPELLEAIVHPRVCPHFHIPLQSGSDAVLERMGRRYRRQDFLDVTRKIQQMIPGVAITSDVIVGFPGEREADYRLSEEICRAAGLAGLHVFPYSPRRGTPAATFPDQIPSAVKQERAQRLGKLARELADDYARGFVGQIREVLAEEKVDGAWTGHTNNYLKVFFTKPVESSPGEMAPVIEREDLVRVRLLHIRPDGALDGLPIEPA
ncbi:tRNA (N(6)-L-threonylcarbamoyladenosine(37)-C(2))-methylthiotransferase MtaB [Heliobacterium undosum]|uniref:Threonylcarbamoyladenosine tRNA methylthiotransferase MtaB n=1 Tax=Heliomicrobium undosum TaxID=121734 RepID=A0A845L1F9_9FIRM|nr:tRNA (N(6)-L-threonylcarbamoyladenosine(37)-C(2))-methylthiotransferase MtaB [Heliomicrobium undosum]MZP28805.1 tRNA (N(6)-L-threonylcarbamoyladenosine(37)-C(2))-methylthiotransferase MtaB [Heliomicrobium undosum]